MTTAKELAAATQAQRLAEGYRKRFEAAAMGADNADDVVCSLARTLLRRASGSPQPEPIPIPAEARDVVRETLSAIRRQAVAMLDYEHRVPNALSQQMAAQLHQIDAALTTLEAAPTEGETLGYGGMIRGHMAPDTWHPHQKELAKAWLLHAPAGSRIVRLVAEPGHD